MRVFKFAVPMMLIVGSVAWFMLNRNFQDVPGESRVMITVGAMVLSGIISLFLFPKNEEEPRDKSKKLKD